MYQNSGWTGFGEWLGTGKISNREREYRSFNKARDYVRKLNLKSQADWREYCKSGKKPLDIPSSPNKIYKNKGWLSLPDWLGTIEGFTGEYLSFKDARSFIRGLGLTSTTEWYKYAISNKKPSNVPVNPQKIKKKEGVFPLPTISQIY